MVTYIKQIYCVLGVILFLASFWGIYYTVDVSLAKASDLRRVEIKVDRFILSQRIAQLQQRIWQIEDKFGRDPNKMPLEWKNEYRCLKLDLLKAKNKERFLK